MGEEMTKEQQHPVNEVEMLQSEVKRLTANQEVLVKKLQEMNMVNVFKRLDYLFKVLEFSSHFNADFMQACTDEIESLMTIKEREDDGNKES